MPQSRKWQLTVNNPLEKGITHEVLKESLAKFTGMVYWCMCDKTGSEGTYHTHVYFVLCTPTVHTVVDNRFPNIHRENVKGTSQQNRDYVLKDGEKYNKSPAGSYNYTDGSGKTRSVMDKYGYQNCYRVTDYRHSFDTYNGQDVIIFEEYRSQFKIADVLNYLDGYPLLLPCRYFNRQACYTKVFIISNLPLEKQYTNVTQESRSAFFRRIHQVREYQGGSVLEYDSVSKYMTRPSFVPMEDTATPPWGNIG